MQSTFWQHLTYSLQLCDVGSYQFMGGLRFIELDNVPNVTHDPLSLG